MPDLHTVMPDLHTVMPDLIGHLLFRRDCRSEPAMTKKGGRKKRKARTLRSAPFLFRGERNYFFLLLYLW